MNNNKEFDRIIREKMNNRTFEFDESGWMLASKQIAAARKKRKYVLLLWFFIPALVGVVIWSVSISGGGSSFIQPLAQEQKVVESADMHTSDIPSKTMDIKTNDAADAKEENENRIQANAPIHEDVKQKNEPIATPIDEHTGNKHSKGSSSTNAVNGAANVVKRRMETLQSNPNATSEENSFSNEGAYVPKVKESEVIESEVPNTLSQNSLNGLDENARIDEPILIKHEYVPVSYAHIESKFGAITKDHQSMLAAVDRHESFVNRIWKISVLAGGWNTVSQFSGGKDEAWMHQTASVLSPSFGVEGILSKHHMGFGAGIHFTQYGETIASDPIQVNVSQSQRYWYLVPVDTTILIITDSILGSNGYTYQAYSQEATINVITAGTHTTSSSRTIRDQRLIQNRVSYIEMPIIGDIHAGRGRWLFGIRGGPTIGKLVTRVGSLPNPDGGYSGLNVLTFNQWMAGYTLRMYAHYKIGARCSIGLEPGIRGQFGNSIRDARFQRTTHAWGGMMSLNFIIPSNRKIKVSN